LHAQPTSTQPGVETPSGEAISPQAGPQPGEATLASAPLYDPEGIPNMHPASLHLSDGPQDVAPLTASRPLRRGNAVSTQRLPRRPADHLRSRPASGIPGIPGLALHALSAAVIVAVTPALPRRPAALLTLS